jgi:hypothetical protein
LLDCTGWWCFLVDSTQPHVLQMTDQDTAHKLHALPCCPWLEILQSWGVQAILLCVDALCYAALSRAGLGGGLLESHSQILVVSAAMPVLRQLLEQHCVEAVQTWPLGAPPVLQHVLTSGVAGFVARQLLEQQLMLFRHAWPLDNFSAGQPAAQVKQTAFQGSFSHCSNWQALTLECTALASLCERVARRHNGACSNARVHG